MSSKPDVVEKKERVGILRKRDTTGASSSASSTIRPEPPFRHKPITAPSKILAKPAEEGGSLFSKRTKIIRDKPVTVPLMSRLPRSSVSASHSTTTVDSHVTAASQSSFAHKPGHRPAYLRHKSGVSNKNLIAVQVQCNKKQYNQIKKELTDIQNKAVDYYRKYRESLIKLNKLNGKDEVPAIEDLKIIDFTENSGEDQPSKLKLLEKLSFSKLKQISNECVLGQLTDQVRTIQVPSFKLLQEFSNRLSEINSQIKSSDKSESGDTNLFPTKIQNLFDEIEQKIIEEERQQILRTNSFITHLKQVMINEEGIPVMMKDAIPEEYENFKKANQLKVLELDNKIKDLELKQTKEEHKNAELNIAVANEQFNIKELKCVLAQHEAKRGEREAEMERMAQKLKQAEINNKRYEKMLEVKNNETALKDTSIEELKSNLKSLQEKLSKITNQSQKMENKITRTEEESKLQMDKLKAKYEEETKICDQLRSELNNLNTSAVLDNKPLREENERLKFSEKTLEKEIYSLKLSLNEMMHTKSLSETEKTEELVCRREMVRMEDEMRRMKTNISDLQDEVNKREIQLTVKMREIAEFENMIKQLEQRDKVNEYKSEIGKLQEQINQKTKENEQLQSDLTKALTELHLQEESLFMQQRLLKIRSELIQSLQDNEDVSKTQLAELNTEMDKKSYVNKRVNLNQDVSAKTEELENLFASLGAKNVEVKRQDHIIKLLEETHERNQRVRVKQEEKIARLENENADLKKFIKYKE